MASAFASAIPYVADALVILGVFVMTVGVYGAIRMPDTYTKLHAMSIRACSSPDMPSAPRKMGSVPTPFQ